VLTLVSIAAAAGDCTEDFDPDPFGAGVYHDSYTFTDTTQCPSTPGLTITFTTAGDGPDPAGGLGIDSNRLDVKGAGDGDDTTTERITIESGDGKAFVFKQIWVDINPNTYGSGFTIKGIGPEPFTILTGAPGSIADYPGSETPKLVTSVEITSVDFFNDFFDDIDYAFDIPGCAIYGNATLIVNEDTTPSSGDDTNFGATAVGTPVDKTFTISSIGLLSLDLTGSPYVALSNPTDFSVQAQPTVDPIASGSTDTFTIRFSPASAGVKTCTVTLENDSEAHPYTFTIQGEGSGAPEIDVEGNGTSIPNGDNTPEVADHTHFGNVEVGSFFDRTFTIQNEGNAPLTLTNHPSAVQLSSNPSGDFSVETQPTTGSIAASGSETFVVRCTPSATGDRTATVSIANNDTDEDPYTFDITCSGVDTTKPDVAIDQAGGQADPTNSSPVLLTAVFDEPINDATFTNVDVSVGGTATTGVVTVTEIAPNDDTTFEVSIVVTGDGTVIPTIPAGGVEDPSGNTNNASTSSDNSVLYDGTKPSAPTLVSPADNASVNTGTPTFTWNASTDTGGSGLRTTDTYRYQVTGPTPKDDYTANTNYTPSIALADGVYTWRIYARDNAGNNSDWSTTWTLTVDTDKPDVTIDQAGGQADPTNASPVTFTAVFDEPINDATFTNADVNVGGTATTGAVTVTEIAPNDDTTFEVSIVVTADGTVVPTIPAGGVEDVAGNTNNASTGTDNSVTYDTTKPDVTIDQAGGQADPTNASPVTFTAVFDEPINDATFAPGDVSVGGTATTGAVTVTEIAPNDDTTFEVSIAVTGDGTVQPTVPAGGVEDPAGNTNNASTSTDNMVTVDMVKPDVTIDQAGGQADPTNASPVTFTAVFDEPINDVTFTDADVSVGGTATTGAVTVTEVAPNDDTTFEVSIVVTADGTVQPTIPAGGVEDPAGNTNNASTSTDNSVTYDITRPDVTIDQKVGQADPTNTSPVLFTVVFNEPVDETSFTSGDISFSGTATTGAVTITEVAPNDDTTFEVSIVVTGDGTVIPRVSTDGVLDKAGNPSNASTSTDDTVTFDTDPPAVDSVTAAPTTIADATAGTDTFTVVVEFDETMGTGTTPTLVFSPDVVGGGTPTLSNGDGVWSTTTVANDTFTMTYDVADQGVDHDSVTIDVEGAQDLAGNGQEDYTPPVHEFDIDTLNPTISSITSTTLNGYYGSGSAINVSVSFSESVTLAGGTLDVTLDTPSDVVSVTAFASQLSANTTYTVGAGDNSCDLDATAVVLNGGTLRDDVGNDAVVGLPATTIADDSDIVVDTTDPAIAWVQEFPSGTQNMDADCTLEFPIEVQVTDNCCIDVADVSYTLTWPANVSVTTTLAKTQISPTRVDYVGTVTVKNLTSCPATVDLDFDATDCAGNAMTTSSDSVTVADISPPTYTWITDLPDTNQSMDDDCSLTFPIEILIEDNCCIDEANVVIAVSDPADVTVANTLTKTQEGANAVRITGDVTLSALTDGQATVQLTATSTDCCGNVDATLSDSVTVVDDTLPTISGFTVTPDDGRVDTNCEEVVTVYAVVSDNCCIDAASIFVYPTVTNALMKNFAITATQNGLNEVIVSGTIVVYALTGCPAEIEITIDATDCGGNGDSWDESAEINDAIIPVIHDLRVDEHVVLDECCTALVTFDGYVADNCCVLPSGITITVTHPTSNATVAYSQAADVTFTQNGQGRVDFAGEIAVSCVTSCPAIVQVTVNAEDCCGNSAVPVSSTADPNDPNDTGHVYDETEPIPRDDPRQDLALDESAIIDPLVVVQQDSLGVYRLTTRENTPVRIDVLANDADSCSCEDCDHPFDPCGPCGSCSGCCAAMFIHEIVTAPAYGTLAIEDDEGDCGGGTVIRFAPDTGFVGTDEFTYRTRDACGNVSTEIATVYLQVAASVSLGSSFLSACPGVPLEFTVTMTDPWIGRDDVEFTFSVLSGPSHGAVSGDLTDITLTPPDTGSVTLTYTPSERFSGTDQITVQVEDPFGNSATAVVSIDVTTEACAGGTGGIPGIDVAQGEPLMIIAPYLTGRYARRQIALLFSLEDGMEYSTHVTVTIDAEAGRRTIIVDTGPLPLGRYLLSLGQTGRGENLALTIEVVAGEAE